MSRVRVLLAGAALGLLPLLSLPGTAVAGAVPHVAASGDPTPGPTATEAPAPEPSATRAPCLVGCVTPTPVATEAPVEPTAAPTTAAPTTSPTPVRTYTRPAATTAPRVTRSPQAEVYATGEPIIGGLDIGSLATPTSSPSPTAVEVQPAAAKKASDPVSKLVWLAVGGALLLGGGGALGLYLTRHA